MLGLLLLHPNALLCVPIMYSSAARLSPLEWSSLIASSLYRAFSIPTYVSSYRKQFTMKLLHTIPYPFFVSVGFAVDASQQATHIIPIEFHHSMEETKFVFVKRKKISRKYSIPPGRVIELVFVACRLLWR